MARCSECGTEIRPGRKFCAQCGAPVSQAPTIRSTPSAEPPPTSPSLHPAPDRHNPLARFLNEEQNPSTVNRVYEKASQILTRNEEIVYIAVQKKPLNMNLSPDCIVLTTRRFIVYHPKVFGQVEFEDYIWRDLKDAQIKEGIIGATFTISTVRDEQFTVESLPKAQARHVYSFAQEMEENVLEERRLRDMEEKRAAAGGVMIQGMPQATPTSFQAPAASALPDPVEQLSKLKQMLDANLITAAEYEAKKNEILSRM